MTDVTSFVHGNVFDRLPGPHHEKQGKTKICPARAGAKPPFCRSNTDTVRSLPHKFRPLAYDLRYFLLRGCSQLRDLRLAQILSGIGRRRRGPVPRDPCRLRCEKRIDLPLCCLTRHPKRKFAARTDLRAERPAVRSQDNISGTEHHTSPLLHFITFSVVCHSLLKFVCRFRIMRS